MNIQVYCVKKNFDVQKAERFFKERRIAYQLVDMKKHAPGRREIELFARAAGGLQQLLDKQSPAVLSHPVAYTDDTDTIISYLIEHPEFMRTPIVRNGQKATVGADEQVWSRWLQA